MEFRTTTGGTTALQFDEFEHVTLKALAQEHGRTFEDLAKQLADTLRQHPLESFEQIVERMFPIPPPGTGRVTETVEPADATLAANRKQLQDALMHNSAELERALKNAKSIQVEALLCQALATVQHTKAMMHVADEITSRLDRLIDLQRGKKR